MADTTKQELLRRAATLVGVEQLATALKVQPSLLEAWMTGRAAMPDRKLIVLAEFLDGISQPSRQ